MGLPGASADPVLSPRPGGTRGREAHLLGVGARSREGLGSQRGGPFRDGRRPAPGAGSATPGAGPAAGVPTRARHGGKLGERTEQHLTGD